MRNAMKVAGLGVANGTMRGPPFSSPQSAVKPTRTASAAMSSSSAAKAATADVAAPPHRVSSSWDDWEFAEEYGSELVMEAGEPMPMPRVVFHGGVPSFDEAKDATTELKQAIDQYVMLYVMLCYVMLCYVDF